ncbi:MAG TPA: MotA/TolQ/ExbB proton channel family protein [Spirochaetota bacterium]|nr:MotA/TolQ/ExbB proton channel family protein [Spirochaetota bacterium]HPC42530.1 MotA/TolQ/ExbB proton channel family protein [Spirochaetota bacterium]HPL15484.1 MotA/TolQ/ExbB proton channel family protein [Spirochaetota bacterium]HQF10182.1 MotA/TolQ/ExbB proton channel family protein [Spirochaetota bacterium]HQH98966.1 MotA/TolQ/ExbB proton channel family protein [Spirochaetota bacterium]
MMVLVDYGETVIFITLAAASVIALGVCLDRYFLMRPYAGKKSAGIYRMVIDGIRSCDIDRVRSISADEDSIYARFAAYCLLKIEERKAGLDEIMASRMLEEESLLEKRLPVLNTLGNNAPFIGLLGTVLGVIKAFHGLGTLGNTGAEVVMRGISTALLATAAGLFIAVPVVMFNNFFMARIQEVMKNLLIISKEMSAFAAHASAKKKK